MPSGGRLGIVDRGPHSSGSASPGRWSGTGLPGWCSGGCAGRAGPGRHRTNFQVLIAAAVADLLAGQPDPAAPHPGRVEAAENTPPLPCWGSTGRPRPPWRCLSPSGTSSAARLPRRWPITRLAFATVTSRPRCWAAQVGTLMACNIVQGVHGSRWAPRSSKSMSGASGVRAGFDSLASRQLRPAVPPRGALGLPAGSTKLLRCRDSLSSACGASEPRRQRGVGSLEGSEAGRCRRWS